MNPASEVASSPQSPTGSSRQTTVNLLDSKFFKDNGDFLFGMQDMRDRAEKEWMTLDMVNKVLFNRLDESLPKEVCLTGFLANLPPRVDKAFAKAYFNHLINKINNPRDRKLYNSSLCECTDFTRNACQLALKTVVELSINQPSERVAKEAAASAVVVHFILDGIPDLDEPANDNTVDGFTTAELREAARLYIIWENLGKESSSFPIKFHFSGVTYLAEEAFKQCLDDDWRDLAEKRSPPQKNPRASRVSSREGRLPPIRMRRLGLFEPKDSSSAAAASPAPVRTVPGGLKRKRAFDDRGSPQDLGRKMQK